MMRPHDTAVEVAARKLDHADDMLQLAEGEYSRRRQDYTLAETEYVAAVTARSIASKASA